MKYSLEDLLTVEELTAKLKVSVRNIRDWKAKRKIPFTMMQRRLYFDAEGVERILQRNAVEALAASPIQHSLAEQGGAQKGDDEQ